MHTVILTPALSQPIHSTNTYKTNKIIIIISPRFLSRHTSQIRSHDDRRARRVPCDQFWGNAEFFSASCLIVATLRLASRSSGLKTQLFLSTLAKVLQVQRAAGVFCPGEAVKVVGSRPHCSGPGATAGNDTAEDISMVSTCI